MMKAFRDWLLGKQENLDYASCFAPDQQRPFEGFYAIQEAGEFAARLGLADLYRASLQYNETATPKQAIAFLAECLAGLPTAKADVLTANQAARTLGVRKEKVLRWIRTGELRASNVSQGYRPRWRIKRADLDGFLAGRNPTPRQPKRERQTGGEYTRHYREA